MTKLAYFPEPLCQTVSAPATCGELMQGWIDGNDFLINSPINWYSTVRTSFSTGQNAEQVKVLTPGTFSKLALACTRISEGSTFPLRPISVDVLSQVPRGKGLASSTSELSAGISAAAALWGMRISPETITEVLLEVDRSTDGVYLPGISMRNHLSGKILKDFGPPPPLKFIIVETDKSGIVETSNFERARARTVARRYEPELRYGIGLLKKGFILGDPRLIAQAATISARINQEVLFKTGFEDLLRATGEFGALGVNCAHTGTVLGVMFDPTAIDEQRLQNRVESLVTSANVLGTFNLISGGLTNLNGPATPMLCEPAYFPSMTAP